jgi:acetylornithine/succinyldiaminopimelate/putrescine aminotransferase
MRSCLDPESKYCARNYYTLPVVLTRGERVFGWDDAGKKYLEWTGRDLRRKRHRGTCFNA